METIKLVGQDVELIPITIHVHGDEKLFSITAYGTRENLKAWQEADVDAVEEISPK